MAEPAASARIRIVYVVSRFPAISHSFIQREIAALRELGVEIHTVGLRASDPSDIRTAADRADFERTFVVLPVAGDRLLKDHLVAFLASPRRYLRVAQFALQGAAGVKERIRRLGHFAEAGVVWRHCRRVGISHLHAHFERPSADVAMLVARLGGGRKNGWSWSFTAHNPMQYLGGADGLSRKVADASFVVCVSNVGRSLLMALVDHDYWHRLHVVRCGVNPDVFRPQRPHVERANTILTVARLVPLKGHALLLEALAILHREGSDAQAVLVGDGPERSRLELLAAQLDVAQCVEFAGDLGQDVIRDRYAQADVFCLPSFLEGVPAVLMEAMAMELPVVASRISGIPELVDDRVNGRLVTPGSPAELAAVLAEILSDSQERRAAMGAAGRARVREEFEVGRSAHALRELFIEAIRDDPEPTHDH